MKPIRIAVALVLVAGAAWLGLNGSGAVLDRLLAEEAPRAPSRSGGPARVETAAASMETVRQTAEAVGSTQAIQSIDVQPMADGRVVEVAFEEGADVEAGRLLIQLDDRTEQAALREAEASLVEVRGGLERARQLAEQNIQSNATLEASEALVARAEAVRDQAANAVEDRRVMSAFAGTVGLADVDVGQMVTTASVLTGLDDLSEIEVTFSLPEAYFASVEVGQTIIATSDAYGSRDFEGRVSAIGTRIDAASRSFPVQATIPNEDRALATGMFMGVSIVLEERRSVTVPEIAVTNEGDKTYLFAVEADKAVRRDVVIGIREGERVEIREGLEDGVPVVVSGLQRISDGAAVEVVSDGQPATAEADGNGGPGVPPPPA
ncbi:MAG: efflux RND transporter periplasmic adaptor subunit, partial [Rhizobiaceae bacterium]|nr:efflux RND transporter periplasmic adaptor subunit [Rhizobiaceae bacterium]